MGALAGERRVSIAGSRPGMRYQSPGVTWCGLSGSRSREGIFPAEGNPWWSVSLSGDEGHSRVFRGALLQGVRGWGGHPGRMTEPKQAEEGVPRGMAWPRHQRSVGREVGRSRMGRHLSRRAPP